MPRSSRLHLVTISIVVILLLSACGGSSSTAPTPRIEQISTTISGTVASQSWDCENLSVAAGPVTASVAPEVTIELGTGECSGPDTTAVAHGDHGFVTATMPTGHIRVRLFNSLAGSAPFELHVTFNVAD